MKISASVVLYNPSNENLEHIRKLSRIFDKVYVFDNSEKDLKNAFQSSNIIYETKLQNMGIAFALENSLKNSIKNDDDFLLTLDQDSIYPFEQHNSIVKRLLSLDKDIAIFALTTDYYYEQEKNRNDEEVATTITSGNFINVHLLEQHDIHFPVELFIDYVDFEFNRRITSCGLKIVQTHKFYLIHTIGNPLPKRILWLKFNCMNHSPIRYYYQFRNAYYLLKKYPKFYKKISKKTLKVDKWKMRLFEPNKKAKNRMIKIGIKDAKAGKLGAYGQ